MAIEINPLIEQATIEKNAGNHENAIQLYSEAINQNPQQDYYYHLRAILYYQLEDYGFALDDLDTAISISPNVALNFYHRGNTNLAIGELNNAAFDYDEAINLKIKPPYDSFTYTHKGLIENRLFNYKAAYPNFEKALLLNPDLIPALIGQATAKAELKDLDGSFSHLCRVIELNPNHDVAYQNMGNIELKKGKFEKAVENYNKAYSLNPKNIEIFHNRGLAYEMLNQKSLAISNYSMLIPYSMGLLTNKQHYVKISEVLKFREINEQNILSIKNRQIWFAHPDTFIDKTDGKYLLHLFPDHEDVKQAVESVIVYSCFGMFLNDAISADITLEKNQKKMWEEYGANGKGFCLYYEYNPALASKAHKFSFDKISYVQTAEQKENTSLYDTLQQGFFTKIHEDYYFENEARFITIAEKSSKLGKTVNESELGFILTKVDFGVLCTLEEDRQKVIDAVNARGGSESREFYELTYADGDPFKLMRTKLAFG